MAKKLIRKYYPKANDLQEIVGQDVDIIIKSKSVYFGKITEVKKDQVIFRDKINNKIVFRIQDILEIITDQVHHF